MLLMFYFKKKLPLIETSKTCTDVTYFGP